MSASSGSSEGAPRGSGEVYDVHPPTPARPGAPGCFPSRLSLNDQTSRRSFRMETHLQDTRLHPEGLGAWRPASSLRPLPPSPVPFFLLR
jgi:hypothetical protein